MEIEAKFVIPDQDAMLRLQRVVRLGPFVPGRALVHEILDVYLDTQDRTLHENGYACRIRHRAGQRWLTLKGLGGVEQAIHSRFESEQALPAEATADPETWSEGEGRTLVLELAGGEPLLELIEVQQVRQVRPLHREERLVAELSLDQAEIRAGERQLTYQCLEAELTGEGEIDDLGALTEHLSWTWGLEPEPRSKYALGWALLEPDAQVEAFVPDAEVDVAVLEAEADIVVPNAEVDAVVLEAEADIVVPNAEVDAAVPEVEAGISVSEVEVEAAVIEEEAVGAVPEAQVENDLSEAEVEVSVPQAVGLTETDEEAGELAVLEPAAVLSPVQEPEQAPDRLIDQETEQNLPAPEPQPQTEGIWPDTQTSDPSPVWIRDEAEASDDSAGSTTIEELCERFQVDMDHAHHVTESALLLFDRTESIHHLDVDRRRLLAAMAMLHNVGLEVDPDRHHVAGRDIVLENWLEALTETEQRMLAAAVYLHRKRIRRRRLEASVVASLPLGLRQDTLILAALVRMADGLDYSQSQSTSVENVKVFSAAVQVEVAGPSAQVDAARAQAKADLWEVVFGDTPFFFAVSGQAARGVQQTEFSGQVELVADERPALGQAKAKKSPGISPNDPMWEAGRKVLLFHMARMLEHEAGTREGVDIEELHDMRVATRRMRSACRTFAAYYEPRAIRPYVVGLRRTARALGKVRDLDVFMQKARVYLDGLGPDHASDLDVLLDAWQEEREAARVAMIQVLDGPKYHDFVDAFQLFLGSPGAGARRSDKIPPRPVLVRHVAPQLIYGRWASVQAFGPLLEGAPVSVLHALRIECKRLRYTLEFFSEVLAPAAKQVIEAVIKLQDHLGDLNDADVANAILSDFLFSPRPGGEGERLIAPGVVAYLAVKQRELQVLAEAFPPAWEAFNQPSTRQALAEAVGVL